jgi:hypothetical protein
MPEWRITRRGFWSMAGAGALLDRGAARGAVPQAAGGLGIDLGGPPSDLREVVLFPFDDVTVPLRYRLQVGLVPSSNPYMPHRRVLEKGPPGTPDGRNLSFYGTVLRVGDELRMWYLGSPEPGVWRACYAVSKDGIAWTKPELGLAELGGNTRNNLVGFDRKDVGALIVLHEPEEPDPDRRFKMIYEVNPFHIGAAFSPDGLRWKDSPRNPILRHNSLEPSGLVRFNGCYYLNGQGGSVGTKRALVTYVSYDFDHWTDAVAVGLRRDLPPHRQSPGPHAGEQVHLGAALWNRGNVLIGVYGQWHGESNDRRQVSMDLGLVVSNDAMHFREPIPDFQIVSAYEIFMSDRADAAFPAPALEQGQAFENIGDRTMFWYSPWYGGSICVAAWARDRLGYFETVKRSKAVQFATEDAQASVMKELNIKREVAQPHFVSCPLRVQPGARVFLNAAGLSEQAHLTVEVFDAQFRPLPGYSGADCVRLTRSGLREPVVWRGRESLDASSRPVRLKVSWGGERADDALLYAAYVTL